VAAVLGVNELLILGASAATAAGGHLLTTRGGMPSTLMLPVMSRERITEGAVASLAAAGAISAVVPFSLWSLFVVFFKVGALLFGSGYVLLAFIRSDLVERFGWLTEKQLLDAVAVGQVTPGPVFSTATFIGFILGGPVAAIVATVAIFLPAFFFVAVSGPLIPWLRRSALARSVLDGVVVASLALMAVVTWHLGRAALTDPLALVFAGVAAFLLIRYRVNSVWLILAAGALGFLLRA
jgi:chromate transporter